MTGASTTIRVWSDPLPSSCIDAIDQAKLPVHKALQSSIHLAPPIL